MTRNEICKFDKRCVPPTACSATRYSELGDGARRAGIVTRPRVIGWMMLACAALAAVAVATPPTGGYSYTGDQTSVYDWSTWLQVGMLTAAGLVLIAVKSGRIGAAIVGISSGAHRPAPHRPHRSARRRRGRARTDRDGPRGEQSSNPDGRARTHVLAAVGVRRVAHGVARSACGPRYRRCDHGQRTAMLAGTVMIPSVRPEPAFVIALVAALALLALPNRPRSPTPVIDLASSI